MTSFIGPFLGSALGLTAVCSLGWGNLVAFDWNDLPVGREFDCKFLKNVKSPPHALSPPPAGITLIGALRLMLPTHRDSKVKEEGLVPSGADG